jgi:predicted dehydrogenase
MTVRPVRIGVIGVGFGARVHVPAVRRDPRCVVAAVASRDAARAEAVAAALDIPVVHRDWRALIADPSIDAVSLAVPPADQPGIIIEAARTGKHVFCEKPVGASLDDAEHALDAARRAGIVHAIDFIFPEIAAWQRARDLLRGGVIGAPRRFSYVWRVQTVAARTRADSWKNRPDEGGGACGNFLPHVIFNLEWLLGRLVGLDSVPRDVDPASFCDCVAHLAGGIEGSITVETDARVPEGHRLQLVGESGTLMLSNTSSDYAHGFELRVSTGGREEVLERDVCPADGDGRIGPVARIVRRFVDGILEGWPAAPNLEDGVRVQRWLGRINHAVPR